MVQLFLKPNLFFRASCATLYSRLNLKVKNQLGSRVYPVEQRRVNEPVQAFVNATGVRRVFLPLQVAR